MSDTTTPLPARPEYDRLVFELRALVRDQHIDKARATGAEVMQRAEILFKARRISGADLTRLHALRMRLDAMLPLPGDQPPALDASEPRPIEGGK